MIELLKTLCHCIQRVNNSLLLSVSQSLSMCMNCAVFLLAVIEVASGEYGDLNPVLFEAVQGGLCSDESKKNSIDKNDPTTSCPSQCYNVSDEHTLSHTKSLCLSVSDSLTSRVIVYSYRIQATLRNTHLPPVPSHSSASSSREPSSQYAGTR